VIGRGGFSRVILVRKKDSGRLYAMKIMKKNKIMREKKLKPILSERKVLEKIKHPFIIKLHWAFQSVKFTSLLFSDRRAVLCNGFMHRRRDFFPSQQTEEVHRTIG
jgi:serine/threonine protein kinase